MANESDATFLQRFFKTGPGEYGEGDRFLGIRVPALRKVARAYRGIELAGALELLRSRWHEERLAALFILVGAYASADAAHRERVYRAYLANTRYVNNWDLVDSSAEHIVGRHTRDSGSIAPLRRLARSKSLWERRIAMLATFHFIKQGEPDTAIEVAGILVADDHELIHKAVGWMLRESWLRERAPAEEFLRRHHRTMPRTMLRYAIERMPDRRRRAYMKGLADGR